MFQTGFAAHPCLRILSSVVLPSQRVLGPRQPGVSFARPSTMSRLFSLLALFGSLALGQVPDTGRIERRGDMATLVVDSPRPLDSAALTLAVEFGIPISVEDPPYLYREDLRELPSASTVAGTSRRRIPKGGKLEVSFKTQSDGSPEDVAALLKALLVQANSRFPFAYRMDGPTGGWVTFVPTQTRDVDGHAVSITPLMDRQVTILPGRRSISEHAQLMVAALSTQTGLRVACCQVGVAGIPWGMEVVDFEATQEPARDVLRRLAALSINGRPNGYYWLLRCDDSSPSWCFVNLGWATKTAKQQPAPDRPPQQGPERWFTRGLGTAAETRDKHKLAAEVLGDFPGEPFNSFRPILQLETPAGQSPQERYRALRQFLGLSDAEFSRLGPRRPDGVVALDDSQRRKIEEVAGVLHNASVYNAVELGLISEKHWPDGNLCYNEIDSRGLGLNRAQLEELQGLRSQPSEPRSTRLAVLTKSQLERLASYEAQLQLLNQAIDLGLIRRPTPAERFCH